MRNKRGFKKWQESIGLKEKDVCCLELRWVIRDFLWHILLFLNRMQQINKVLYMLMSILMRPVTLKRAIQKSASTKAILFVQYCLEEKKKDHTNNYACLFLLMTWKKNLNF